MNDPQNHTHKPIILVVDDVPDNLRVLSATLSEQGYQVRCAKSGSMALMAAQSAPPDLILLDVKMPDMNGYTVCQKLKSHTATSDIPVIFLSALDDIVDKVRGFEVGGVDYVTKPFKVEEVLARISNHLALQNAKAEIRALNAELENRVQQRTAQIETTNQKLTQEILERQKAEKRLQESEERLESILNSLQEMVWSVSAITFKLLYINPAAEQIYDRPLSEFYTNPNLWLEATHPEDRPKLERSYQTVLEKGSFELEYRILRLDGEVRWVCDRSRVIYDERGVPLRIDGITEDITERKRTEEQLIHDALHDVLTGLPNRTLFMERVETALKLSKRNKDYRFALLFIDLDRFKIVNDSLGHGIGDRLLVAIARILESCLRETDTVARLGGDEFTILLEGLVDIADATRIADRIGQKLLSPIELDGHTVFTSASIGMVIGSSAYEQGADLLRDADIAMYRAKEQGKARYTLFDREMYAQTLKLLQIENDLRVGLERQEFLLHYQPIVSLKSGKITGFEALIRWKHPKRGLVFPGEFIPVAEDTGLIIPLGEWVLREACRQHSLWLSKTPQNEPFTISVNLAGRQIREQNLLEKIDGILAQTGLNGSKLRLEITESMLMDNTEKTIDLLSQLRARNIILSIDDFGQGYSSLSYLPRFPVNLLKIDRAFIWKMTSDSENLEIVRTIISLAHTLGMEVIAEGVETIEQMNILKELNCEFAQGYFFSKPLDCLAAEAILVKDEEHN
ncbi:MAG: EAL domain-containing protein [Hydrococcus sp. Prado102]|jgi:diguanylate cyclase (GGDEF)-like protein/PAS domain S-box-containing protein|nr:EAL domain-containing protein [Hydrococcus sp. Prado102]